jgi:hypothetical protein
LTAKTFPPPYKRDLEPIQKRPVKKGSDCKDIAPSRKEADTEEREEKYFSSEREEKKRGAKGSRQSCNMCV